MIILTLQTLLAIIASSYLTLGIFVPEKASALWWEYGLITFVISVTSLLVERRRRELL
jgi:hypothetical protein